MQARVIGSRRLVAEAKPCNAAGCGPIHRSFARLYRGRVSKLDVSGPLQSLQTKHASFTSSGIRRLCSSSH